MTTTTYAEAVSLALRQAIERDDRVVLLGNLYGGITEHQRWFDRLGADHPTRVLHPPWSELGICGMGIGAACTGLRPVVDVVTASFLFQGFPQVVNEAANIAYASGGQTNVPVVFHMLAGIRGAGAAQHSHSPQAMLWNTPGLRIAIPARPSDAYGLLRDAILEAEHPTAFVSHPGLLGVEEEIADLDRAATEATAGVRVARAGRDVTVAASSIMVGRAEEAAAILAAEHGVDAEVVDLRTLVPFDADGLVASVAKTGRLVVADECHRSAGVAAEVVARVVEAAFGELRAPPRRVSTPDVPIPFSPPLEAAVTPWASSVVAAVLDVVR